ncbi:hypothetical protein PG637_06095 [Riemerella anatipestifer]|nr:hypothetical protein [Riemerella anatipestifer]MDY3325243.1 hypothetical protein [Riemerella anatipestifer]
MMKNLIVYFCLCCFCLGCGQNTKSPSSYEYSMNLPHPEINSNNFVEELNKAVKRYDKEPLYYLRFSKSHCFIEILINDYTVYLGYSISNLVTPLEINEAILKSGKQKLTYRLYPVGDAYKREYEGFDEEFTTLTDQTAFSVSVIEIDNRSAKDFDDEILIAKHHTPTDEKGNFIGSGKPYYEGSFTFTANVPYEINTLDTAKDLSKLDKEELEKKALEWNKMVQKIYETKDKDALARIYFEQEKRNSIAYYATSEDNQELWDEYLDVLERKNRMYKEMKDYKMSYFSNNRLVSLLHNTPDIRYVNGGILTYFYTDEDGDERYDMDKLYLYMPKDSEDLFPF